MEAPPIWSHFEALQDPRVERTRRHRLMDIVIISVLSVAYFAHREQSFRGIGITCFGASGSERSDASSSTYQ
jgi:hypothetical protein